MSAFSQKYSPEQKDAIVSAILDGVEGEPGSGPLGQGDQQLGRQMTAKEAVKAAAEGRLPGLEPFVMNLSTARNEAQEARRERDGKHDSRYDRMDPMVATEKLVRRMAKIGDRLVTKLERKPTQTPMDPEEVRKVARAVREIEGLARAFTTKTNTGDSGGAGAQPKNDEPTEPNGLIAQLAAEARATAAPSDERLGAQKDEGQPETEEPKGSEPAKRDHTTEREDDGDRVRALAESSSRADAPVQTDQLAAAQALLRRG
jgi:hypothetical protein